MAIETHTGRLIFDDSAVAMEDGTVLAVAGVPNPCATAAGRFAKWGETQPVTVTGTPGTVDNSPVLFVAQIQWAVSAAAITSADAGGGVASLDDAISSTAKKAVAPPAKKASRKTKKATGAKSARSGSKK